MTNDELQMELGKVVGQIETLIEFEGDTAKNTHAVTLRESRLALMRLAAAIGRAEKKLPSNAGNERTAD